MRYIADERVKVVEVRYEDGVLDHARVHVRGGDEYLVVFNGFEWVCDCPARLMCAHEIAARTVVETPSQRRRFRLPNQESELSALFDTGRASL